MFAGLGIWVRTANLANHVFWEDEVVTSVHAAGYSGRDIYGDAISRAPLTAADLVAFQTVNAQRPWTQTVYALAVEDPQHPPLYYLLERMTVSVIGNSIADRRALSVLFGLLCIPAIAWLAWELFRDRRAAFVAAALVCVSPVHTMYSQQAREYSLWTLLVAIAGALLLRFVRTGSRRVLAGYTIALILSLYTYLFSLFVVAGHFVYVAVRAGRDGTQRIRGFAVAAAIAILAYAPWLAVVWLNRGAMVRGNTWSDEPWPVRFLAAKWAFNLAAAFFDLEYKKINLAPVGGLVLLVLAWAVVLLVRRTNFAAWGFLAALCATSAGLLLVRDLVLHHHSSTITRYLIPMEICSELAIAWAIAAISRSPVIWLRRLAAPAVFAFVVGAGAVSTLASTRVPAWWDNNKDAPLPAIAAAINAAPGSPLPPLIISEHVLLTLALANDLSPGIFFVFPDSAVDGARDADRPNTYIVAPSPPFFVESERRHLTLVPIVTTVAPASVGAFRAKLSQATKGHTFDGDELAPGSATLWRIERGGKHGR